MLERDAPSVARPPKRTLDPVIAAYMGGIDRTLLRENLKLTVEERLRALMRLQRFAAEMRRAGRQGFHDRP